MRLRAAVAGGLACLTLTGCLGLRSNDDIRQGLDIQTAAPDAVTYLPPGPQPGAEPESIIRGFVRAGATMGDSITIAQSFLSRTQATRWNPETETVVISGESSMTVRATGQGTFAVTATKVATIDSVGRHTAAEPGAIASIVVRVNRIDGQWRIVDLPGAFGRWMTATSVSQLMRPVRVHYVDATGHSLMPDVRWLANDRLATRLARAQIGPVPSYLAGAARSDLAGGIRLTVDAVTISDGVATVDLASAGMSPDPVGRVNIWAQLVATLTQVPEVDAVRVTVEGADLDLSGVTEPVSSVRQLGVEALPGPVGVHPLLRVGRWVYPVDPNRVLDPGLESISENPSPFPAITSTWVDLAQSFRGNEIAAVGSDRAALARWRTDVTIETEYFADRLTAPSYDRHDVLFVGGRGFGKNESARMWAVNVGVAPGGDGSAPYPVHAPWLEGRIAVAVNVAVDGMRVAVVSTNAQGKDPRLDICGIERQANHLPNALSPASLRLAPTLTAISDVVWVSSTQVAVIARTAADSQVRPYVVSLGGELTPLPPVPGARTITTVGGERWLALGTGEGIFLRAGTRWIRLPSGSDLAVAAR